MWHETPLSDATRQLFTAVCQHSAKGPLGSELELRLLYGLGEVLAQGHKADDLEAIADLLGDRLADNPPAEREQLRLATRIAIRFLDLANGLPESEGRKKIILTKYAGLSGLLTRIAAEESTGDTRTELEKEADKLFESATYGFLDRVVGSPPEGAELYEGVRWRLHALARLRQELPRVLRHQPHFAAALAVWMRENHPTFEAVAQPKPLPIERADLGRTEADCLIARAEWDQRAGLLGCAFNALFRAAFATVYVAGQTQRGRELAARALEAGDRWLRELGPDSPEAQDVRTELYQLARLTGDADELARRLEARVRSVRAEGNRQEQAGDWLKAADAFSHLGYLYFVSSQYAPGERLRLLAVYFFERSLACRERAAVAPRDPSATELDPAYRRCEAQGFMAGASAALSTGDAVGMTLRAASQALGKAADLTFQDIGLFEFYKAAGNHFESHRHLCRAAELAHDWHAAGRRLARAAETFRRSFEMFLSVYRFYYELLSRVLHDRSAPIPAALGVELGRLGHPDPDRLLAAADRCRQTFGVSPRGFRDATGELLRWLIFINPQG